MLIIKLFALGFVILLGAIILNAIASWLSVKSWYDFLAGPANTSIVSYIWLFIVYPFGLGMIGYVGYKALIA